MFISDWFIWIKIPTILQTKNKDFYLFHSLCKAQALTEIAKEAMSAASIAMDSYNKVLDLADPWEKFHETMRGLDKYREDYSKNALKLYINIRYFVSNGISAYYRSTEHVYEWCYLVTPLLKKYIELFNEMDMSKLAEQRDLLIEILDNGIKEMKNAQNELDEASSHFNSLAGTLTSFRHQLDSDFSDHSDYLEAKKAEIRKVGYGSASIFGPIGWAIAAGIIEGKLIPELKARLGNIEDFYKKLNVLVDQSFTNIGESKDKIKDEIRVIGELKVQTEETKTYAEIDITPELKDIVIEAAQSLISKCNEYKKRIAPFTSV